jgi:hypothetical protein
MDNIPRLTVQQMLFRENSVINAMIIKSIEEQLTLEWVQSNIDHTVRTLLQKAIEEVANDYTLRSVITETAAKAVSAMVENVDK